MTGSPARENRPSPIPASDWFRIVAPVNRPDEVEALANARANEIYCGMLPPNWSEKYGDWDSLSRRQGNIANLSTINQLGEVASRASRMGMRASLALNVRYTAEQIPDVLDMASAWERAGGDAVIVSSLGVLLALMKRGSTLSRHISILANVTNSRAVAFFRRFGATRVVLPRELTLGEMESLISHAPDIEYEAMALNEKCRFIDGLCGFYHGTSHPNDTASVFSYRRIGPNKTPTAYAHDLCYAGHGCQIQFRDENGSHIPQLHRDDINQPPCAACSLIRFRRIGLRFLKIGGRGLPTELKLRAVSFLRDGIALAEKNAGSAEMRHLYQNTFGQDCQRSSCYYENDLEMKD